MTESSSSNYSYARGGMLDINDPTYVPRPADRQLATFLKAKKFCYVLNPRQTGKSSLLKQVKHDLEAEGISCCKIYLLGIFDKTGATRETFYKSLYTSIIDEFNLSQKFNGEDFWNRHKNRGYEFILSQFVKKVLLEKIKTDIVIFIDEIDSLLQLDFVNDFFKFLKTCHDRRREDSNYERLTFALFGVATPGELFENNNYQMLFEIGKWIELTGFDETEIRFLDRGLREKAENPKAVIREVSKWTNGQPYLTQKVCRLIQELPERIPRNEEQKKVADLVQNKIINNWQEQDEHEHFRTIEKEILQRAKAKGSKYLLELYRQLLRTGETGELPADNSKEQRELRISGLVIKQGEKLKVNNKIYESIFNRDWVEQSISALRPYENELKEWQNSNRQDSLLLCGDNLKDALKWAFGKLVFQGKLEPEDIEFLNSSIEEDIKRFPELREKAKKLLADLQKEFDNKEQEIDQKEKEISQEQEKREQESKQKKEEIDHANKCRKKWKNIAIINGILVSLVALVTFPIAIPELISRISPPKNLEDFSLGQRILFPNRESYTNEATKAFQNGNFQQAINYYQDAVKKDPNNPEIKIYLNNAKIKIAGGNELAIAVVIPKDYDSDIIDEILRGIADAQDNFLKKNEQNNRKQLVQISLFKYQEDTGQQVSESGALGVIAFKLNANDLSKYQNADLVVITPTTDNYNLSSALANNPIFQTSFTDQEIGQKLAKYLKSKSRKDSKTVIFYDSTSTSSKNTQTSLEKEIKGTSPSQIIDKYDLSNVKDSYLQTITSNQVDAVVLLPSEDERSRNKAIEIAGKISDKVGILSGDEIKQRNSQPENKKKLILLGNQFLHHPQTLIKGGNSLKGLILAVPWPDADSNNYKEGSRDEWQGKISWRTATSYDAATVLLASIEKLGENIKPDEQKRQVIRILKEIDLRSDETSGDRMGFSDKGQRIIDRNETPKPPYLVIVDDQNVSTPSQNTRVGFKHYPD